MLAFERRAAEIVLGSFATTSSGLALAPGEVDYLAGLGRFMEAGSEKAKLGIRFAVLLAYTAPLWMGRSLRSLAGLGLEQRGRVLDAMSRHRVFFVRELCLLLKLVACMAIFRSAEVRARTNYDRPAVQSVPLARISLARRSA